MYKTPLSNRLHIGIFGRRNTGKSSLINSITNQDLSIVSSVPGTTTDPVYKSIEILPIGPCVLIDTAGIDDDGVLGDERVKQTIKVLRKVDIGIIVIEPQTIIGEYENTLIKVFSEKKIPFIFAVTKSDLFDEIEDLKILEGKKYHYVVLSSKTKEGINDLKKKIIEVIPVDWSPIPLVKDIVKKDDIVVLVCPIDSAMPKGRLILPEVQVLRDVLDANALGYVAKETGLSSVLNSIKKEPNLVITDSQVFHLVKEYIPSHISLTSFSIIFARHKGDLKRYVDGVAAIENLNNGDYVLISESCTHHVQPEDIGRVKIPKWIREYTGKDINLDLSVGRDFPENLKKYKLIIQCGGCMVNRKEILYRIDQAKLNNIPITNYGVFIAYINGILNRVIEPFGLNIDEEVIVNKGRV